MAEEEFAHPEKRDVLLQLEKARKALVKIQLDMISNMPARIVEQDYNEFIIESQRLAKPIIEYCKK